MIGKSFGRQTFYTAGLFVAIALSSSHPAERVRDGGQTVGNVSLYDPLLEYHFHTYFNVNDPEEVALAIDLRNEIIANCVDKKIIAIPSRYHYDPENPVKEYHNDTTGLSMRPVGPHPIGQFETWVPVEYFAKMYEWFVQKRSPLNIFIHPLTEHEMVDHTQRVVFMGKTYTLNTTMMQEVIPNFKSQYEYLKLGHANPHNHEK